MVGHPGGMSVGQGVGVLAEQLLHRHGPLVGPVLLGPHVLRAVALGQGGVGFRELRAVGEGRVEEAAGLELLDRCHVLELGGLVLELPAGGLLLLALPRLHQGQGLVGLLAHVGRLLAELLDLRRQRGRPFDDLQGQGTLAGAVEPVDEGRGHLACVVVPILGLPAHGLLPDGHQVVGQRPVLGQVPRRPLDHLFHDRGVVTPLEGRVAGEHLEQDRPQAVHVGAGIDALAPGLFRRHVGRCARDLGGGPPVALEPTGQTPVDHQDLSELPDHHVFGLQVPVHGLLAVGESHGAGALVHRVDQPAKGPALGRGLPAVDRRRPVDLADDRRERAALDLFHGEVQAAIGQLADVVDRHDARVLEHRCDARFGHEAGHGARGLQQLGLDDLHRDAAIELLVPDPPDLGHAADPDHLVIGVALIGSRSGPDHLDLFLVQEERLSPRRGVGHQPLQELREGRAHVIRERVLSDERRDLALEHRPPVVVLAHGHESVTRCRWRLHASGCAAPFVPGTGYQPVPGAVSAVRRPTIPHGPRGSSPSQTTPDGAPRDRAPRRWTPRA